MTSSHTPSSNVRYFVRINPETTIVQNFYSIPPGEAVEDPSFHEITCDDFEHFSKQSGAQWKNGTLSVYTPPPPPLTQQAQNALQIVQQKAAMITAMGETFGPKMRDYVKTLQNISDGSNNIDNTLPDAPEKITD
ncbi:hypothetical protein [Saccharibacter floricola]|uniref:Uncharacterized protein n=1 Tax=Saccharibacter floricola DSM 15669 TaxID=1123227 RepID=A0ABQ0P1F8_9PROT|nr:hypothetical protein [Saccharibacter floricola]GBQ08742.1 hypothetical protein AA15669_1888 [Saccharibacter floricola DSM 15669]